MREIWGCCVTFQDKRRSTPPRVGGVQEVQQGPAAPPVAQVARVNLAGLGRWLGGQYKTYDKMLPTPPAAQVAKVNLAGLGRWLGGSIADSTRRTTRCCQHRQRPNQPGSSRGRLGRVLAPVQPRHPPAAPPAPAAKMTLASHRCGLRSVLPCRRSSWVTR